MTAMRRIIIAKKRIGLRGYRSESHLDRRDFQQVMSSQRRMWKKSTSPARRRRLVRPRGSCGGSTTGAWCDSLSACC